MNQDVNSKSLQVIEVDATTEKLEALETAITSLIGQGTLDQESESVVADLKDLQELAANMRQQLDTSGISILMSARARRNAGRGNINEKK